MKAAVKRSLTALALVGTVSLTGACSAGGFTLNGTLWLIDSGGVELLIGFGCKGLGNNDDIQRGAEVTVSDPHGATIGIGSLGAGQFMSGGGDICRFPFSVSVPGGKGFYTVTVGHTRLTSFAEKDARSGVVFYLGVR